MPTESALPIPTRRSPSWNAIRMYTIWAARSGFEEDIKGSLEPGKLADMVVLSKDPLSVSPEDLMSILASSCPETP